MPRRFFLLLLLAASFLLAACGAYQKTVSTVKRAVVSILPGSAATTTRAGYTTIDIELDPGWKVGIFQFLEPVHAPGTGAMAAQALLAELNARALFPNLTLEQGVTDFTPEGILARAEKKGYDLIFTGELTYYLDGGDHQDARVEMLLGIIRRQKDGPLLSWQLKGVQTARAVPEKDLFVYRKKGRPASPASALLYSITGAFCDLLPPPMPAAPAAPAPAVAPHPAAAEEPSAPPTPAQMPPAADLPPLPPPAVSLPGQQ